MKYFQSICTDPYQNLAMEYSLLQNKEETLFLWQNKSCVVIGRHQNPYSEINLELARKRSVPVVRRYTGGGAVYHDSGNINYSFIIPEEKFDDVSQIVPTVLNSLSFLPWLTSKPSATSFEVEKSGRNDIMINNKKIGGTAWMMEGGWILFHGTILLNTDLDFMQRILTPSKLKLGSKGIASVRSRVANLSDYIPECDVKQIIKVFESYYGNTFQEIDSLPGSLNQSRNLRDHNWIFGSSPQYSVKHEIKVNEGVYQIYLNVRDGRIHDIKVFSDSLSDAEWHQFDQLTGKVYEPEMIEEQIYCVLDKYRTAGKKYVSIR